MAFFKKDDEQWLNEQVRRIYQDYETLRGKLSKAMELEEEFYQRYKKALRSGFDLREFLTHEHKHVQDLLKHHDRQQREAQEIALRKEKAQNVLQAEIERIALSYQHYPRSSFVDAAEFCELAHLYGAINQFEGMHWHALTSRLRKTYALTGNSPLTLLEETLMQLTPPQALHEPQALLTFSQHFRSESPDVEQSALEAMKSVAFFLNDLKDLLDSLQFPDDEPAYIAITQMIYDFRLSSIKRRSS